MMFSSRWFAVLRDLYALDVRAGIRKGGLCHQCDRCGFVQAARFMKRPDRLTASHIRPEGPCWCVKKGTASKARKSAKPHARRERVKTVPF